MNKTSNTGLIILFFTLICTDVLAQSFESLWSNLYQPQRKVVSYFEEQNFMSNEIVESEFCLSERMVRDDGKIILNFCNTTKDTLTDFVIKQKEIELFNRLQKEVEQFSGFQMERKYVAGFTSFIYTDPYNQEISFIKFTNVDLYFIMLSGYPAFDDYKTIVEEDMEYNESQDPVFIIRNMFQVENSKNQTLENGLRNVSEFSLEGGDDYVKYVEERRESKEFSRLIKVVDDDFLSDTLYVNRVLNEMSKLKAIDLSVYPYTEEREMMIAQMMVDNDLIGSMVVLNYFFESFE